MSRLTAYNKFIQQALKYGFSLFGPTKTGQTVWYVGGDDGWYKKGYPSVIGGPRLVDNGDGTVTDMGTGLMWVANPTAAGIGGSYAWIAGLAACSDLNYAGHNDWRMPNIKEGQSLIKYGKTGLLIDTDFFTMPNSQMWSSTTVLANTLKARTYSLANAGCYFDDKTTSFWVHPVRGGIA